MAAQLSRTLTPRLLQSLQRPNLGESCEGFPMTPLDSALESVNGTMIKVVPNRYVSAEDPDNAQRLFGSTENSFWLCPEINPGIISFNFVILDGVGGKSSFPLTVHIIEERSARGQVFGGADTDYDGDGTPNTTDAFIFDSLETTDADGDGVGDNADAFPSDSSETIDTDGDGIGDNADTDIDGDGVLDVYDHFPQIVKIIMSRLQMQSLELWTQRCESALRI